MMLAATAASGVWDDKDWKTLTDRYVDLCLGLGALTELPHALTFTSVPVPFRRGTSRRGIGDRGSASSHDRDRRRPRTLLPAGTRRLPRPGGGGAVLAQAAVDGAARCGEGWAITGAAWATALVNNGLCHYGKALDAAQQATEYTDDLGLRTWALVELVEAAARSDAGEIAATAYRQLAEMTDDSGTDWALA